MNQSLAEPPTTDGSSDPKPPLRVHTIEVEGLFNLYDHRIPLHSAERVTVVHGPNGVGKTVIFRLLDALFNQHLVTLAAWPYRRLEVDFGSSRVVVCQKRGKREASARLEITFGDHHETFKVPLESLAELEQEAELLSDEWSRAGGTMETFREIRELRRLADETRRAIRDSALLRELSDRVKLHVIGTDRLEYHGAGPDTAHRWYPRRPKRVSTVDADNADLRGRAQAARADSSEVAQRLDRSFPQRLISRAIDSLTAEEIQDRMVQLGELRGRYDSLGLLDKDGTEQEDPDLERLDDTQRRVFSLYVHDSQQKLDALQPIAEPLRLFLDTVNRRFSQKQLTFSHRGGLSVRLDDGASVPLTALSSGEQHLLVLLYDLLFRVERDSLALLDEPEISLHLGWQKQFLPDLLAIAQLRQFDVLLATHSPAIVGDRDDLMVPLSLGK